MLLTVPSFPPDLYSAVELLSDTALGPLGMWWIEPEGTAPQNVAEAGDVHYGASDGIKWFDGRLAYDNVRFYYVSTQIK